MDPWGRGVVGHRAGKVDPLVEVRVVKLSSGRSSRVRFVAEEFEGREEWVPPARLKAPWAQVETYALREARWDAVTAASPVRGLAEDYAAMQVFDTLIDETLATLGYNQQAATAWPLPGTPAGCAPGPRPGWPSTGLVAAEPEGCPQAA